MSESYFNKENRILEAIDAWDTWDTDDFRSVRAVALKYDVNVRTLQRRLNESDSRIGRSALNKAFSDEQEMALCDYIKMLDQVEQSARFSMIQGAANYLFCEAHSDVFTSSPKFSEF